MDIEYDVVIVGAGPAGIALAHCCSSIPNFKTLIIEQSHHIGGCHRVNRVNYQKEKLFTEHGPRIYSSTYKNFDILLREMGTSFIDLFTPYNFQIGTVGGQTVFSTLTITELLNLTYQFVCLLFNENYGNDRNMMTYMMDANYSKEAMDLVDRICRLSDGGNMRNFSLHEFLQTINQQLLYTIYQPKEPMDTSVFPLWEKFLKKRGVTILCDTTVTKFHRGYGKIESCDIKGKITKNIRGKQFVIATPPVHLVKLIEGTEIKDAFGDFNILEKWSKSTDYIEYISIVFHWDHKLTLPKVYGFPKSDWGVAFIVLSDYMPFIETNSKTVISTAITITDKKSKHSGKTANQCKSKEEVIDEVFKQLKEGYPNLEKPTIALMTPNNYYDAKAQKWDSSDTAFIAAFNTEFIPFQSKVYNNMYNLGTHNGKSKYKFTSLESAVSNAIYLACQMYPVLRSKYSVQSTIDLRQVIMYAISIIVVLILIYIVARNTK